MAANLLNGAVAALLTRSGCAVDCTLWLESLSLQSPPDCYASDPLRLPRLGSQLEQEADILMGSQACFLTPLGGGEQGPAC